jgi:hypothetical protein
MHAFMGAVIALIYASSYLKDQLLRQREMAEAMHRLAHTDQLTGVANRAGHPLLDAGRGEGARGAERRRTADISEVADPGKE